jgi:predicted nucleotidyltransferase
MTDIALTAKQRRLLDNVFRRYGELRQVILFGSRATGRAHERSDIDLATRGLLDRRRVGLLALDLEELPLAVKCEVHPYEEIDSSRVREHIDKHGVAIYEKSD